jgi:hypothetical protein
LNLEDTLYGLAMEPERAAEAMVTLFRMTLDEANVPVETVDDEPPTDAELAEYERDRATALAKFWKRCDELVGMVMGYEDRPEFDPFPAEVSA